MVWFRLYLLLIIIVLTGYTAVVGFNHGWNLLPIFFGDILNMTWPGQFNADFMGFLLLSGLWLAWRHRFSPLGILLGVVGVFGGMMFLAPYLLWLSIANKGNINTMLLGEHALGSVIKEDIN